MPPGLKRAPSYPTLAAQTIAQSRLGARLTQKELAETLGTKASVISAYENGRIDPTVGTLERIVRACGMTLKLSTEMTPQSRKARMLEVRARWKAASESGEQWRGKPPIMPGFQEQALLVFKGVKKSPG